MKTILFAFLAVVSVFAHAEPVVLKAIDDFPILEDGDIPFYKDTGRDALAINAANESYRGPFARASTTFTGSPGSYDVTITALGEIDGECSFRLLINGELIGEATNVRVEEDWGEQYHVFENVQVPQNATLSVEANAVSNGLIPEHDAFAFARGRWRALTLDAVEPVVDPEVDLSLTLTAESADLEPGQETELMLTASNAENVETATAPLVTVNLPDALSFVASSECQLAEEQVTCALSELVAGGAESVTFTVSAVAAHADPVSVTAQVISDQSDANPGDNTIALSMRVSVAQAVDTNGEDAQSDTETDTETETGPETNTGADSVDSEQSDEIAENSSEEISSDQGGGSGGGALLMLLFGLVSIAIGRLASRFT